MVVTPEEPKIDTDRVDDAVLALLRLGLHQHWRVWKSFDWEAMDRLHKKGFISDPSASRNRSRSPMRARSDRKGCFVSSFASADGPMPLACPRAP
jgi:hypothetical protein